MHSSGISLLTRVSLAAAALNLLAGCTGLTQAEIKFLETRQLNASYDDVYDAALNAILSMNMTIQHSDKGSGVISGQAGDHAQRAKMSSWKRRRFPVKKVTLLVRPKGPRRTQIRMKVLINERPQLDRRLMTLVWQRIERAYMLESGPPSPAPGTRVGRAARPSGRRR